MTSRFDDMYSTRARKGAPNGLPRLDFSPTSADEQHDRNGNLRTGEPWGSNGPVCPPLPKGYPTGGTAGSGDADDYNVAATHPAYEQNGV